jgi:hypothetical protein
MVVPSNNLVRFVKGWRDSPDSAPFTYTGIESGANRKNPDLEGDLQGFHPGKRQMQESQ